MDGGNMGLSAYKLTAAAANKAVKTISQAFPGIDLAGKQYVEGGAALIMIVVSEDEPYIHMYDQDAQTGAMTRIEDFNVIGLDDTKDWPDAMTQLLDNGKATVVPLGTGSAEPYWWK